jgi:hypothetical protein
MINQLVETLNEPHPLTRYPCLPGEVDKITKYKITLKKEKSWQYYQYTEKKDSIFGVAPKARQQLSHQWETPNHLKLRVPLWYWMKMRGHLPSLTE